MRILLYAALVLSSTVNAQVIECPKFFPSKDLALSEVPSGHKGSARLQPARLSHAYMYVGELYGEQTMVPPGGRKVKGGRDAEYNFAPQDPNWLICTYGGSAWGDGDIEWWEKLDPKINHCVLTVREIKEQPYPIRWTAAAVCKSDR
jgi:hypothetical protein